MTRHTYRTFSVFIAIAIVIIVGALYFVHTHTANAPAEADQTAPAVSLSDVPASKTISDKNDFYEISGTYPIEPWDTGEIMQQFVAYKVAEKQKEWAIGGDVYTAEQNVAAQFPDRPKMTYQFLISYERFYSEKYGTVSYVFTTYEYTGGANGNTIVDTFSFNKEGEVSIETVLNFDDNQDIALSRVLAAAALQEHPDVFVNTDMLYQGLGVAYLNDDGTFNAEKCRCNGFLFASNFMNFIISDSGMTFRFNKYAVAPGAAGTPDVFLSWEALAPYLADAWHAPDASVL